MLWEANESPKKPGRQEAVRKENAAVRKCGLRLSSPETLICSNLF